MTQKYRKIDPRIWRDERFVRLDAVEKMRVLESITFGNPDSRFAAFLGPMYRVPSGVKRRRADLYTAAWRRTRLRVIREQGTTCVYCGCDCAADPTVDHVVPVCAGGDPGEQAALVVSCRPCNSAKGGRESWA